MKNTHENEPIVIIGAGIAAVYAAESARKAGFDGRIIICGDESEAPYDRPPLSKKVLQEAAEADHISLRDNAFYDAHDIDLRLGNAAQRIDRDARQVMFADGTSLGYGALVLATGSSLRTLPLLHPGMPHVFYLRRISDAIALREALPNIRSLAVVGAGVIGLEVASVANGMGIDVTVLEAGDRPMARATCVEVCNFVVQQHEKRGVRIRTGVSIKEVTERAPGYRLALSNGESLDADAVVVGIGVVPNVSLAAAAGIETCASGICVDGRGRTSDEHIYAAGEVAFHFNARAGRPERQENWHHAVAHGEHVGRAIVCGGPDYEEISGYWSDQYDFSLQSFGVSIGEQNIVRGDPASGAFVVFHLQADVVVGVSAVGAPREMRAGKALVRAASKVPVSVLRDASIDLAKWRDDRRFDAKSA
ncbi:Anthranilate 1,2-dioxygenase system ferredoxin--NAD(+) reductase component [Pandoraea pneumonica]|uniref:Anthranilate 1,2-dioxygenase system ferredoxin--NAD(+) reductase component n=1 Tax=Pandoraea pneumonica TaxID=2508299 RepID=A0A5E4W7K2_9BURK|nr:FAD-dependent oxidoreductase [Pandoraea pneumonica]VVE20391.1 Anthranilate 1,2-dioxygenase system ferredoxin--NAD(+) reductase component [Pandoraea pneumonica]